MRDEISFELSSFFMNAGITGFIKMLEHDSNSFGKYRFDHDVLYVDKDYLLKCDLTDLFFKTAIDLEKNSGKYPRIIDELESFCEKLQKEELNKDNITSLNAILKLLDANSYQNAIVMRDDENYTKKLYSLIKIVKLKKDKEEILNLIEQIIGILKEEDVYQNLFFREIAYRRINKFWDSVSFLNRNNAKKDMKKVHSDTFETCFKDYMNSNKDGQDICEECGTLFVKNSDSNYSFLKGTAADVVRKRNDFWNYKVNSWVCPKCRFIYSCIPLGFAKYNQKYLFLNCINDVKSLRNVNQEQYQLVDDLTRKKKTKYNGILLEFLKKQDRIINDLEVISADENDKRFKVNVINKDVLILIKENFKYFENLMNCRNIKVNDNYYLDVFDEAFHNIVHLQNSYGLIHTLIKQFLAQNSLNIFYSTWYILKIQNDLNRKRRGGNLEMNHIDNMKWLGEQLQECIFKTKNTRDRGVLTSLVYRLLNAVKSNDIDSFNDIVIRTCVSYKAPIPTLLLQIMKNHEDFHDYAYAYILGIESPERNNDKKSNNLEEGNE